MINQEQNENFPIVITWLAEASHATLTKSEHALSQEDNEEGSKLLLLSMQILETAFDELEKYHKKIGWTPKKALA